MSKSLKLFGGSFAATAAVLGLAYASAGGFVAEFPNDAPVMGARPAAAVLGFVSPAFADEATPVKYGIGRTALPEEVAAWDKDVSPDGTGLPEGSGDAITGEPLFEDACASCHGSFAEGVDNWPKLAGGDGTLADDDPLKTVGSYWPYLSTVWDYVHRSMPFGNAQSLSNDDVYAIVAYILYSNDMVEDDFVLSRETFLDVEMGNADGFIVDDRPESEYAAWRAEPCMENCKDSPVKITMRATVLDVTPEETEAAADAAAAMVSAVDTPAETATETVAETVPAVVTAAAFDVALAAEGEKVFGKCKACHQVGDGAKNRTGPHLNGVVGRAIGGLEDYKYSRTMAEMGGVWDEAMLAAFLSDPRGVVKGTKMAFAGLKSESDIAAVTEYLKSVSQ